MTELRIDPAERLPFTSGWLTTWRAAIDLLAPVRLPVLASYVTMYFSLRLAENLAIYLYDWTIPDLLGWAYLGFMATVLHAVSTVSFVTAFLGLPAPLRMAVKTIRQTPGAMTAAISSALVIDVLHLIGFAWALMFLFWLAGPPLVNHAIAVEGRGFVGAVLRTRERLTGRGAETTWPVWIGVLVVFMGRQLSLGVGDVVVMGVGGLDSLVGAVLDAAVSGLTGGVALACISALWTVAYLNARALRDPVTSDDLRQELLREGRG